MSGMTDHSSGRSDATSFACARDMIGEPVLKDQRSPARSRQKNPALKSKL
jgi:hypothetical protein